ncbi:LytTR family DNA-binding domain-containing protein [Paenibacillus sp. MMS20-IR301]|uniref:LytTR family DNA-binding domain-containing protein n=1 Tax=Paenibacillus sp. MMS20-IR301 TaxID=2895946 RepID=UPI0028E401D3|nr:LytTR family DNA-binding domain-containing protein [Paenibacillus sp. MMS20-IR301]WNS42013.1 LytTR family DNA-binding domain-containing protein [Paenibacillus sp. MMS20-IR301]
MEVIFEANAGMNRGTAKVVTHPAEQANWGDIEAGIQTAEQRIVVINARNNRELPVVASTIAVIEPEGRMCSVRLISGEMYLLHTRLKFALDVLDSPQFMKINNQTIINTRHIKEFSATDQARIQVMLTNGDAYFVSRHYIKNFRRNYHG